MEISVLSEEAEDQARRALVAEFASFEIPRRFEKIFLELEYAPFEQVLAKAVMQIECTARPLEVRVFEYAAAFIAFLKSIITSSRPRNFTVGVFQIGIVTSLNWTRSRVGPWSYFWRLILLGTDRGSARMFRIAIRRSGARDGAPNCLEQFSKFYNGRGRPQQKTFMYLEILSILVSRINRILNRTVVPNEIFSEIDRRINSRLDRIRILIKSGSDLDAVVMLASVSTSQVLYAKYYGGAEGRLPVLDSPRPVGSEIKVALYSAFIEKLNADASMLVDDCPMQIEWRGEEIRPRNSDRKFRGKVTLEYAFANSINIPALQMVQTLGIEAFVRYLQRCGIRRPLPHTPLIALGPVGMTGVELLATLSPILSDGLLSWPNTFKEEADVPPPNDGERVLSIRTFRIMRGLLKSTIASGTASYLATLQNPGLGGKTGTSEGGRDFWFLGAIDADRYGLVWMGYKDGRKIQALDEKEASASRFAVPLWAELLAALLQ